MMSTDNTEHPNNEISLKELILQVQDWFRYFLSKWYILLIAGVIGAASGWLYAVNKKPFYTATTTFVLENGDKGGISQYAGMAAMVGIDLGGAESGLFQGDNILELYKSRTMIEKALLTRINQDSDDLLIDRFVHFNKLRDEWHNEPELLAVDFKTDPTTLDRLSLRLRDSLINEFVESINTNNLQVDKLDKKLSIIKVDVKSLDEIFSKSFNEALVHHVNQFYVQTKTAKSIKNISTLQSKVDSVRSVMNSAINSAANVIDATPNLNPARQSQRTIPSQQSQFTAETNKTILGQLVQNLELSKMNQLQEQPLIQVVDQPVYPLQKDKVSKSKAIIIGAFIFGFLAMLVLISRRVFTLIMEK